MIMIMTDEKVITVAAVTSPCKTSVTASSHHGDSLRGDEKVIMTTFFIQMVIIPAHSSGTGQMFLEDKIHGFNYTYISDENVVQQTK